MKRLIIEIVIVLGVIIAIIALSARIKYLNQELGLATTNIKAYASENSKLKNKNLVFELTLEQMEYYNDSLLHQMKKVANDNGIKDKQIRSLQYQLEHFQKTDTLIVRDTIFKEPTFYLDTCIQDKWSKTQLTLKYPGNIGIKNSFYNNKYIIVDSHKEPIKERKWFLPRWFTRKHIVAEITVVDENPYVSTPRQRFVEIIKND